MNGYLCLYGYIKSVFNLYIIIKEIVFWYLLINEYLPKVRELILRGIR
jgi:hypothetical protein